MTGTRQRYRLLDVDRLLLGVGATDLASFRRLYDEAIRRRIGLGQMTREAHWTESLAVGSKEFIGSVRGQYTGRWQFEIEAVHAAAAETWSIRESSPAYGQLLPQETSL